ncbi:MAG TPA: flagellar biosynthetic protein FliR [Mycobacteriales bacterium]|nr:flagellar biosynthetic protein FliR [Mycobacteriales bacterium]
MDGPLSLQIAEPQLIALLLASVRAAAWLVICPPFSYRAIPGPAKALLSVAIALPIAPRLTGQLPADTAPALLFSAAQQAFVGFALGFVTALLFAAVQSAGDLVDLFGGFSVAFAFDPLAQTGNSVFGRFYGLLASTLLFATDGHQLVLRGFTQSYQALPLDQGLAMSELARVLTTGLNQLFLAAVQIAGPLIAVLFLADLGLGLLSRAAPALNAFSLGFPAKILLTLSLAGFGLLLLPQAVSSLVDQAVRAVVGLAGQ